MNSSPPSWDHCRTFLAVLRAGSLSGAGRELGLTQPTAARHVEALEAAFGRSLFLRTPRGLAPTDAAEELRPYAEALEATAASMLRAASGRRDAVEGAVRVTASEVIGAEVLPEILGGLSRRHPALAIDLELSNEVSDLLRRDADIAVRMVEPQQDMLVARRVGVVTLGLFAHQAYLEQAGAPGSVEELKRHRLIGFERETPAIRALLRAAPALEGLSFALRTDNQLAQLAAIRAGFGVGVCQASLARRAPVLTRVLPESLALPLGVWVTMHEDLKSSARCRAVFDALVEGLGRHVDG